LKKQWRQKHVMGDAIVSFSEIVSHISQDMAFEFSDFIEIGDWQGMVPMRAGMTISIDGIGKPENRHAGAATAGSAPGSGL